MALVPSTLLLRGRLLLRMAFRALVRQTVVPTALTSSANTTDGGPFTVASHTPAAGSLLLLGLAITGTTPADPAIVDSRGWNWTLVPGATVTSATTNRVSVYYCVAPAAVAGTVTLTPAPGDVNTGMSWALVEYAAAAFTGKVSPGVQQIQASSAAAATTASPTLGTLEHANNWHVCFIMHNANEVTTANDSFNNRADVARATPGIGFKAMDKLNDPTAVPSWATSSTSRWVSLEVKAA